MRKLFTALALAAVTQSALAQVKAVNPPVIRRPNPFAYTVTLLPLDSAAGMSNGIIIGRATGVAVAYTNGQITPLPGKATYSDIHPTAIAPNGYIVGFAKSGTNTRGLFWPSMTTPPSDMGALGSVTMPSSINSQGVAVGTYYNTSTVDLPHAFRYQNFSIRNIDPPKADHAQAYSISESGYVAGYAFFGASQAAIRWLPGTFESRVVAFSNIATQAQENGTIYGATYLWDLDNYQFTIAPTSASSVAYISESGRKTGTNLYETPRRAWTVAPGGTSIEYLPTPTGAGNAYGNKVDRCGNILGQVEYPNGTTRAVLWTKGICDAVLVTF